MDGRLYPPPNVNNHLLKHDYDNSMFSAPVTGTQVDLSPVEPTMSFHREPLFQQHDQAGFGWNTNIPAHIPPAPTYFPKDYTPVEFSEPRNPDFHQQYDYYDQNEYNSHDHWEAKHYSHRTAPKRTVYTKKYRKRRKKVNTFWLFVPLNVSTWSSQFLTSFASFVTNLGFVSNFILHFIMFLSESY